MYMKKSIKAKKIQKIRKFQKLKIKNEKTLKILFQNERCLQNFDTINSNIN